MEGFDCLTKIRQMIERTQELAVWNKKVFLLKKDKCKSFHFFNIMAEM